MGIEKKESALVQAQSFPHAVAEHETRVEERDFCVVARYEPAIKPHEDRLVARIGDMVLAARHRVESPLAGELCLRFACGRKTQSAFGVAKKNESPHRT